MGYYVYCIVPASHPPPTNVRGLGDSEVVARPLGEIAAWLSEGDRPEPGVETAKIHNRVVEAAVTEAVTPVPVRFGQWAAEREVIDKAILDKAAWYLERLAAFRGALEFGVRVVSLEKTKSAQVLRTEEHVTGVDYMKALRDRAAMAQAEREVIERVSALVGDVVGPYVRASKLEQPRTAHGLINVVHLVARDCFDSYRAEAETLKTRLPDLRFLLSGPWVPYSFAV